MSKTVKTKLVTQIGTYLESKIRRKYKGKTDLPLLPPGGGNLTPPPFRERTGEWVKATACTVTKSIVLILHVLMAACSAPNPPNTLVATATPALVSAGKGFTNNLNIRIDSIEFKDNGDFLSGEVYISLLAIRRNGNSAKLVFPGKGTFDVFVGDKIRLGDFSLNANNVSIDESVEIYILAFEEDEITPGAQQAINTVLDATILALESVKHEYPIASVAKFAVEHLVGEALQWWQEVDILGEYSTILTQSNDWMRGEQYIVQSSNRNLDITFSIFHSVDITDEIGADGRVVFTIVNQSSSPLEKVFFSPVENRGWGMNWLEENLLPMESKAFAIVAGTYDLRAENLEGLYWEKSDVRVAGNQEWTISDQP